MVADPYPPHPAPAPSPARFATQMSDCPNHILLDEARAGSVQGLDAVLNELSCTVDVNGALDPAFLSPLCLACSGGHEDAALFLLRQADADPNNATGAEAAAFAAAQGCGGDTDCKPGCSFSGGAVGAGCAPPTPLALAVEAGLQRVVKELLARGARVDARRAGDGWTALHMCAKLGNALIMEALLAAPLADAGVRTSRLETPLVVACTYGHLSIVDMLLGDEDADGDHTKVKEGADSSTLATGASGGGRGTCGVTGALRGSRRHAEERTWAGHAPMHRAAAQGYTEVVLRLLAHGASADPADAHGATPLIFAARQGQWGAARALVRQGGASTLATTDEGDTALHAASWAGVSVRSASRVVKFLLGAGAEVDAHNRRGSTGEAVRF